MNQNRKKHEVGHLLLLSTLVLGFSVQALEDAQAVRAAVTTTAAVPTITKATALKVPKKNADGVFKVADSQSLEDAVRAETSATAHAGTAKLWANIKAQLEAKGIDTSGMTVGDTKDETVRVVVNTNGEAGSTPLRVMIRLTSKQTLRKIRPQF
ncbi:hypothetical protein, partial [Lacticaseibacillus camelliae]|uniref:hypothetical protein n=1 Tax=Lacticaseibacillus camelliae TaxID=381742 RepID=UPI0006D1B446